MSVGHVVSVSLGSPRRDWEGEIALAGERWRVSRIGTGGDLARAAVLVRALDGRVAAVGLGGIDTHLVLGGRRYALPQGVWLAGQARRTPVVDGAGWKAAVEPAAIRALAAGGFPLRGRTALVTSVLDRPALAAALFAAGCRVLAGDAYYALGLPLVLSLKRFAPLAAATLPLLRRLPIQWLYPLGERQEREGCGSAWVVSNVDIICGDLHLLRRRLPRSLRGKTVIASTVTAEDIAILARRGAGHLVILAPLIGGRALPANAWEALAVAAAGRRAADLRPEDYLAVWKAAGGGPHVMRLGRDAPRAGVQVLRGCADTVGKGDDDDFSVRSIRPHRREGLCRGDAGSVLCRRGRHGRG